MKIGFKSLLFWLPRILTILFAAFISMFALDVFGEGKGFWKTTLALLMHLVPTALIIVVLVLAWRWDWIGALLFAALGLWYLISTWGRFRFSVYLVISGPLFLIAALFLVNWLCRLKPRETI